MYVTANGVELYAETAGDPADPPLLELPQRVWDEFAGALLAHTA